MMNEFYSSSDAGPEKEKKFKGDTVFPSSLLPKKL